MFADAVASLIVRELVNRRCVPPSFQIVTHQQRIFMILKSLAIEFEPVDIAGPGMDDQKDEMRAKGKKKEGQRHALPPQIFNGEKYCGVRAWVELREEWGQIILRPSVPVCRS